MSKYIIIFITMLSAKMLAQEKLYFDDAIALALEQNHLIRIARNNAVVAENNATIGNAGLLPRLSANGGSSVRDTDGAATSTTNATLSATYTLFDGFGNISRYKRLRSGERLGKLDARDQIEETLLGVSSAYYGATAAYENLQIARELLAISKERFERARKQSAFGRARTIDVLAAQVDLNSDSVTVAQALFRWDEARRSLNILLNRDVNTDFFVDTTAVFEAQYDLETLILDAVGRNAAFLASDERVAQARYDLQSARAAQIPRLDLSGSYGFSQTVPDIAIDMNDPVKTLNVGATLSFTLFDGWRSNIQRQNARVALDTQELLREQAGLNLEKDVTSAYESYLNSLLVLDLELRSLEAAELNFHRTQELYQLGQMTTTQFREAQLNLIRAKSFLSAAKYEAKLNEIELLRLSGRLVVME